MTKKKSEFIEEAIDGDGDGLVQDGTEFERQAECCGKDECEDCPFDVPKAVEILAYPTPASNPGVYVAEAGDTYASLGKKFAPAGVTGFEHAKHLFAVNGGKPLAAGTEVIL